MHLPCQGHSMLKELPPVWKSCRARGRLGQAEAGWDRLGQARAGRRQTGAGWNQMGQAGCRLGAGWGRLGQVGAGRVQAGVFSVRLLQVFWEVYLVLLRLCAPLPRLLVSQHLIFKLVMWKTANTSVCSWEPAILTCRLLLLNHSFIQCI